MLSAEETKRIENYSVWRERQRFTDAQLWERLYELCDREMQILRQLPDAYLLAYSDVPDYLYWRSYWRNLVLELDAGQPVFNAYVWHLTKRGDAYISQWLQECEEHKRRNVLKWQRAVWSIK
jgi:hypothetical protein